MIKWIVQRFRVEISLDVDDCETRAIAQFRSIAESADRIDALKAEMVGLQKPRYGDIPESMMMNAHELAYALRQGIPQFKPILTEGQEIYDRHVPRPLPKGVKL